MTGVCNICFGCTNTGCDKTCLRGACECAIQIRYNWVALYKDGHPLPIGWKTEEEAFSIVERVYSSAVRLMKINRQGEIEIIYFVRYEEVEVVTKTKKVVFK